VPLVDIGNQIAAGAETFTACSVSIRWLNTVRLHCVVHRYPAVKCTTLYEDV